MRLFFSILLCLLLSALTTASNNASLPTRRWHSITSNTETVGPWPFDEQHNSQVLKYCYADANSATHLKGIVLDAIAKWFPAMGGVSSLTILPDDACNNDVSCLYANVPSPIDALVISDIGSQGQSATTIGYEWDEPNGDKRHTLKFAGYHPQMANDNNKRAMSPHHRSLRRDQSPFREPCPALAELRGRLVGLF